MRDAIMVIRPGSTVRIGDIAAMVTCVQIYNGGRPRYLLSWIHDGKRMEEWAEDHEVSVPDKDPSLLVPVGFRYHEGPDA